MSLLLCSSSALHAFRGGAFRGGAFRGGGYRACQALSSTKIVIGDGDLSHSAALASSLGTDCHLIGTVLELKEVHRNTYKNGLRNAEAILSSPRAQVKYGVNVFDSDCLGEAPEADKIVFNFPHNPGKANIKYNRELMGAFFKNTRKYLGPGGELDVALLQYQAGSRAKDKIEWKASWKVQELAMQSGFYLSKVLPFELEYNLSSYRGRDMSFKLTDEPNIYRFKKIEDADYAAEEEKDEYNMCYFHELHLRLNRDEIAPTIAQVEELGRRAISLSRATSPDDVALPVAVECRLIGDLREKNYENPAGAVVVYEICYKSRFLLRQSANGLRRALELDIITKNGLYKLYEKKEGLLVSNTVPESMYDERRAYIR